MAPVEEPDGSGRVLLCAEPEPAGLTVTAALQAPVNQPILVAATLCDDRSKVPCPPCPEGANCARCLEPDWILCGALPLADFTQSLWVSSLPGVELVVGRRYLVGGERIGEQRLFARSVCVLAR